MSYIGTTEIGKMFFGEVEIDKAYLGNNLVYESEEPFEPSLIYRLKSPTTTQNYDTEIQLFDTPKSFSILCEATFNNYSWNSTQSVFGISTGNYFRVGRIQGGYDYRNGVSYETANRYTALIMNNTSGDKICSALYGRSNTNTTRRFAIRYDHTTRLIEGYTTSSGSTEFWWTVPGDLTSNDTLKLLIGNATGTVSILKIYNEVISIQDINSFIG